MNKIKEGLSRVLEEAPSVSVEELKIADVKKMEQDDYITRQEEENGSYRRWRKYAAAAVSFCLCCVMFFSFQFSQRVDTIIDFDINPSIEIELNKKNKVIRMEGINAEGKGILKNIDYKNKDVDSVIHRMLDEMISQGYLTGEKLENNILLSVEHENREEAEELQIRLHSAVGKYLEERQIVANITDQKMVKNKKERKIAEKYDISLGKLTLIRKIMKEHENLTVHDLSSLSLKELVSLLNESRE